MKRCLIFAGGVGHPFGPAVEALEGMVREAGFTPRVAWEPDEAFAALDADAPDLLIVYALRWRMLGEKYADNRAAWAYETTPDHRAAVERHVARGGALLALHTACICFDDWSGWGDILGAQWAWGVSSHPPFGPVTVETTDAGVGPFAVPAGFVLSDEVYSDLDWRRDVTPLMVARAINADMAAQPVVWAHEMNGARVVVDTLGHDLASLTNGGHAALLRSALGWLSGGDRGA